MDSDYLDSSELSCAHKFCTVCWKNYLHTKIQEGNAHQIFCPAFDCSILVPVEVIERHVSPAMARKYLTFDINAFVETNKAIKWCPFPGCNRAVNLPEIEQKLPDLPGLPPTSHAVDCGAGHFFCWECGREAHAPIGCGPWRLWLSRCASVDPSELRSSSQDYQDAANCLWLVTHSKPCPNCKSPIQKNDGCNHIKCSKCRFDFCWVCLESWKKHSSVTGGYFRCNRYSKIADVAADESGKTANRLSDKTKKLREMNRFVHYYTRYKNHENSRIMEEPLLHSAKKKREILQSSLVNDDVINYKRRGSGEEGSLGRNTKFYEDSVWELIKSRHILCGSYVYGFCLEDGNNGVISTKSIFEFMQNELEEVTERLSEMIARPYLCTPRRTIIQTFQMCRRKRQEFLRGAYRGLVPPEELTPPSSALPRKSLTLPEAPSDPWVKQRRHDDVTMVDADVIGSRYCRRPGCQRPRAIRHSRSGGSSSRNNNRDRDTIEFCSMQCAEYFYQRHQHYRHQQQQQQQQRDDDYSPEYNRNLMIALELSRMQMIQDGNKAAASSAPAATSGSNTLPRTSRSDENVIVEDQQLNLAIELSLREMKDDRVVKKRISNKSISTDGTEGRSIPPEIRSGNYLVPPNSAVGPGAVTIFDDRSPTFIEAANETVSSFLKSLAVRNDHVAQDERGVTSSRRPCVVKRTGEVADGMFEIGDIHDHGGYIITSNDVMNLKRSQSTGDIEDSDEQRRNVPYIDSDHSCSEKPETINLKLLKLPGTSHETESTSESTSTINNNNKVSDVMAKTMNKNKREFEENNAKIPEPITNNNNGSSTMPIRRNRPRFVRQKSFEIDSDSTDMEVSMAEDPKVIMSRSTQEQHSSKVNRQHQHKSAGSSPNKKVTDSTSKPKPKQKSKYTKKCPGLTIQIINDENEQGTITQVQLPNKSPTFHISGVSISRTGPGTPLSAPHTKSPQNDPENGGPKSAGQVVVTAKQHRSSSLIVPTQNTDSPRSPGSKSLHLSRASSPLAPEKSAATADVNLLTLPKLTKDVSPNSPNSPLTSVPSPKTTGDRFTFPVTSSDDAQHPPQQMTSLAAPLSSVLHVQDCNLSSDDFHEALFLEKSPKAVKKRRKSKKNNNGNVATASVKL